MLEAAPLDVAEPSTSGDSAQTLVANGGLEDTVQSGSHEALQKDTDLVALNPRRKEKFRLAEKHVLSHNVRRYRFQLQSPQHRLGLPVGKHVYIYGKCVHLPY